MCAPVSSVPAMLSDPRTYSSSPFARLVIANAVSAWGDAALTVALAGSMFFSVGAAQARPKVLLYLALTVAPFVVVAPVIGPLLDRAAGGRRLLMAAGFAARCALAVLTARHLNGLLLYPLAFGVLVLSKGHAVAKAALVPSTVNTHEELVTANSRISLISTVVSLVGGLPAVGLMKLFGPEWALYMAAVVYAVGVVTALRIRRPAELPEPESRAEIEELHAPTILLAVTGMGLLRGAVGFMTFLVAFALKRAGEPAWLYGVVLLASGAGNLGGVVLAPRLRARLREEVILVGSLLVPGLVALLSARDATKLGITVTAAAIAFGSAAGKVAFDSLVQRDGPEELYGRAFARFETRFQLIWVAGALIPVALLDVMDSRLGLFVLAIVLGFAGLSYFGGMRGLHHTPRHPDAHRGAGPPGGPPGRPEGRPPGGPEEISSPG